MEWLIIDNLLDDKAQHTEDQVIKLNTLQLISSRQQTQLLSFLETIIDMATTEQRFGHKYCCEVLFPEVGS